MNTQKAVGLSLGGLGLLSTALNFIVLTQGGGPVQAVLNFRVWSVFIPSLLFLLSSTRHSRLWQWIQVSTIILGGTISILDSYDSVYGYALLAAAYALTTLYSIAAEGWPLRISFISWAFISSEASQYIKGDYAGFSAGLSMAFFLGVIGFLFTRFMDEIIQAKGREIRIENEFGHALQFLTRDEEIIRYLHGQGLSRRECLIAFSAYKSNATHEVIAGQLGIAPGTLAAHLHAIYNKLGAVESKQDLKVYIDEKVRRYAS